MLFRSWFSMHRQALMSDATFTGASKYNRTVYGTWDLSFKEIEKRAGGHSTPKNAQAARAAIMIHQICAFYHHTSISKDIFRSAAEEAIKQDVNSDYFKKLPQAVNLLDHTLLALDDDGHWDEFIFGQGMNLLKHSLFTHLFTIGVERECQNLNSKKCVI